MDLSSSISIRDRSHFQIGTSILACLLLCLFVFFHNLGGAALFEPDEGRNAEVGREILLTQDWVTPHYDFIPRLDKPIFYYWLIALSYKLFGVSEWSARLPSAVAALACVVLSCALAVTMFGIWEALWSGLILATGVEFFILSRTVILDMTLTLFVTLSVCAFYWGSTADQHKIKRVLYLLMYISMGIATLIKGPIGIILPGLVIFFYLFHSRKWFLLKEMNLILGIPLLFLIAGSWYVWSETRNPGEIRYFLMEENVLRFLTPHFNRSHPWYYFFSVLLIGFLPWTLLLGCIVEDLWKRPFDDIIVLLVTWVVVPVLFFSFSHSKLPHYILPVYSPLSILAGKSLYRILRDRSGKISWVFSLPWLTLAAALLVVILALLWPDVLPNHVRKPICQFVPMIPLSFVWTILLILTALAFASWSKLWKRPGTLYLSYCLGFALMAFFAHLIVATISHGRTSKELAEKAAPFIHPEDQIVIYNAYLSSLPFYLRVNRPLWVVWSGKKARVMGSAYVAGKLPRPALHHGEVVFTYEQFPKLWRESHERLLIFARTEDLDRLSEQGMVAVKTLLREGDVILVANR